MPPKKKKQPKSVKKVDNPVKILEEIDNIPQNDELAAKLVLNGANTDMISKKLIEIMDHESIKIDKNGEIHSGLDGNLRYKAIELWCKITGAMAPKKSESKSLKATANLNELSDSELDSLLGGNKKKRV